MDARVHERRPGAHNGSRRRRGTVCIFVPLHQPPAQGINFRRNPLPSSHGCAPHPCPRHPSPSSIRRRPIRLPRSSTPTSTATLTTTPTPTPMMSNTNRARMMAAMATLLRRRLLNTVVAGISESILGVRGLGRPHRLAPLMMRMGQMSGVPLAQRQGDSTTRRRMWGCSSYAYARSCRWQRSCPFSGHR